jgi:hypothetical protein
VTAAASYGPLHRTAPRWARTNGDLAAMVGTHLGFDLDDDQRWSLDAMYAETDDLLPVAPEFCVVGPRQTVGKSVTLTVSAVTDVFVLEVPLVIWTAHEFKTARRSYLDMKQRISRHEDYARRCTFRDSHGEEAIILDTGAAIEFHARSGGSGRGFTTSRLVLDEWLYGQPGDLGALAPTMVTIPDARILYASSAGKTTSAALRSLRSRGRAGNDPSLAYIEHGADPATCRAGDRCSHELEDPGCALNDVELWRQANPGLRNGRVSLESMRKQRRILAGSPREFMREFLSWWEDPAVEDGAALDYDRWKTLAADPGERGDQPVFAVATAPDRSWSAVAVAWRRPDGRVQVQLVDDGYRPGAAWVPARVAELRRRWHGTVRVNVAARGLLADAEEPGADDQAQADNALADALDAGTVCHGNEGALNTAVRAAVWKSRGGTQVLESPGDVDISPVKAAALALAGVGASPPSVYEERGLITL